MKYISPLISKAIASCFNSSFSSVQRSITLSIPFCKSFSLQYAKTVVLFSLTNPADGDFQ
nr:MAG TPA: hypothetical protein [Caudoviricetes sp.]